ncbi:hypothetical protein Tsubulata_015093 [Turnera subulata]|uniref:DNA-(apurinic or apyrimidinic site) endonuclease n=1 Tax=Turnera subulata TaxID=218843 RepID=A0A9Q0G806_9ROSI|nr:hypothetical protein Tsubulata_015093 [Turnera subulata]
MDSHYYAAIQLGFKLSAFIHSPRKGCSFAIAAARTVSGPLVGLRVTPAMASKRSLSTSTATLQQEVEDKKKIRGFVESGPEAENLSPKSDDIQTFMDDPETIKEMTVQQLRTTLRNLGVPVKGRKCDLVSALKSFMDKQLEGKSSQEAEEMISMKNMEETVTQKKAKRISGESCARAINAVSEVSQLKRKMKKFVADDDTGKEDVEIVSTKKKLLSSSDEVSGVASLVGKASRTKRKMSSVSDSDVKVTSPVTLPQAEPWTVLAHKKPQKGWIPYIPRTMRPQPPQDTEFVKLMSWNVNGLRALLKLEGFSALELAQREDFDILCLQETKLQEKDVESIKQCLLEGYENSFWTCSNSKLGYSGTAIISRIKPLSVRYGLGISDHDTEGRLVTAEFDSFYLISGYVPNSGDGLKRLSYRITEWDPSLSNYLKELEKSKPVILTGDLNCAHQEIDIYNPAERLGLLSCDGPFLNYVLRLSVLGVRQVPIESLLAHLCYYHTHVQGNKRSAGFTIEERESFEKNFLSRGFVDTFRRQHPNVVGYTYWGYRHGGRKTNKGWRLDYFLASESIADNVHDSYIVPDVTGSDHCPIGLILKL